MLIIKNIGNKILQNSRKEAKNCKCEKGTFLVFQSGHIIMISKTYKKIQTLYDYMKNYLNENKDLLIF